MTLSAESLAGTCSSITLFCSYTLFPMFFLSVIFVSGSWRLSAAALPLGHVRVRLVQRTPKNIKC